jgi:Sec-independent protein translocase protein TatA
MPTDATTERGKLEQGIAIAKDVFALLRDGSLFLLAILLLFFPTKLNNVLTSAGFEEGSIVGFKWKARLVETDDALKSANVTIESLRAQLKQANDTLAAANAAVPSGELKERIQRVEQAGRDVAASSDGATDAARTTIAANAPLVDRVQQSIAMSGGWAVVFGSDKTLTAARDEISRATKAGIQGVGIYMRNGYYASISAVPTREKAAEYLLVARTFRTDSYTTRLASWCMSPIQRDGYIECAPTR